MARQDTRSISKMIQDNKNNKAERNVQNVELDGVAVALDKPELGHLAPESMRDSIFNITAHEQLLSP